MSEEISGHPELYQDQESISVQELHASKPPSNSTRQNLAACLGSLKSQVVKIERELQGNQV